MLLGIRSSKALIVSASCVAVFVVSLLILLDVKILPLLTLRLTLLGWLYLWRREFFMELCPNIISEINLS